MPNPRAQKPLSFDQIIKDAKSLGVPAQALLDALAGGLKGSVTATVGAPADIYNLLNQVSFRGQLPTAPYGSEDISKMLPDVIPTQDKSRQHTAEVGETMGNFIPTPMSGQALKGAVKLGAKGAKALGEEAGRRAVMGESFTPFVNTAIPQTNVVKPEKGGAWLDKTVDRLIDDMRPSYSLDDKLSLEKELKRHRAYIEKHKDSGLFDLTDAEAGARDVEDLLKRLPAYSAVHEWLNKNLRNYIKNEMGTPSDSVRKLADEKNKIHLEPTQLEAEPYIDDVKKIRESVGMPVEGMAKTPMGKSWEDRADLHIESEPASYYQNKRSYVADFGPYGSERFHTENEAKQAIEKWNKSIRDLGPNVAEPLRKVVPTIERTGPLVEHPWLEKKSPNETIYNLNGGQGLNFKPVTETILNDIIEGRLPAESLKNVSVAQAVARHSDYQDELARKLLKLEEEQQKKNLSANVHKEYDSGHKWIELPDTMSSPENKDFCKGIGKNLGLCTQNDWAAEDYGRHDVGNRLYALIDKEGKPHAQVQTKHRHFNMRDITNLPPEDQKLISKQVTEWAQNQDEYPTHSRVERAYSDAAKSLGHQLPTDVLEIKPPSNDWKGKYSLDREAKYPGYEEKYKPFLDDFVRSGNYGEVGDLYNTNLFDLHKSTQYADDLRSFANKVNLKMPRYLLNQEADILGRHSVNHRLAETAYPESKPIPEIPEELRQYQIQPEPPVEGMKRGGAVHISDNPDSMYMELMDKKMKGGGSEDDTKASFGVFPQLKPYRENQDPEASKDMPLQAVRGRFAGTLGFIPDMANIPLAVVNAIKGTNYKVPYGTEHWLETLPLKATSPAGELSGEAGSFFPSTAMIKAQLQGLKGLGKIAGEGLSNASMGEGPEFLKELVPQPKFAVEKNPYKALPLDLKRYNVPDSVVQSEAERVVRQMTGEHVPKAGATANLAGRSLKESNRVQDLDYKLQDVRPDTGIQPKPYEPKIGDVNVGISGDQTISDYILSHLSGEEINSLQQGGAKYGLGKQSLIDPLFWASEGTIAQRLQDKITDLASKFNADRVIGQHLAMGPISNNFAQHFADANMRAIDYTKLKRSDMDDFNKIIREGYFDPKKKKWIQFPEFAGIDDPHIALAQMESDPNLRKWFNNRMKTPNDVTKPLNLPNGLDVQWAITEPELRNKEINLTGLSVGQMRPNAPLTDTANHFTYSKGIQGKAMTPSGILMTPTIAFPDATAHILKHKRASDYTGTLHKVFPHQVVDQQYLDKLQKYQDFIKARTGKKKGGAIKKAKGGEISEDDIQMEVRPL